MGFSDGAQHATQASGNDALVLERTLQLRRDAFREALWVEHFVELPNQVGIEVLQRAITHADAGQMHLYLNYAREHWTRPGENAPVGLILCSEKDHAAARYALAGLDNKIPSAEYRLALPPEKALVAELEQTRHALENHLDAQRNQRRVKRPKR